MKLRYYAFSPRWDYVLIGLIAFFVVIFRIHDWQARLAMVSGDDSLAAISFYFARRTEFANDAYIQAWAPVALASIINWLPALAYKFVGVHPSVFFVTFTVSQFLFLAPAMFYLAMALTRSRTVAWLTAAFTIIWQPNWWNLALIGGLDWMPYANWFALPLLIYAFASAVNNQRWKAYASLLTAGLIHPIMGMLATIIVAAYIAYVALPVRDTRRVLEAAASVVLIGVLSSMPMLISTYGVEFLPQNRIDALLGNPHVRPWGAEYPYGFSALLSHVLYLVSISILAWSKNIFFRVSLVVTSTMILAHLASVLLEIPEVMTVIASRASTLIVLIALPLAIATLWETLGSGSRLTIIPILALFFRATPLTAVAAALAVRGGTVGAAVGTLISVLVLATQTSISPIIDAAIMKPLLGDTIPWTLSLFRLSYFFWGALGVGLIGTLLARAGARSPGVFLIVISLIYASLSGAKITGQQETSATYKDYKDAQLWARTETSPASGFILLETVPENSWRSLSERPVTSPVRIGMPYGLAKVTADHNAHLNRFYAQMNLTGLDENQLKSMKENFWLAFAKEFSVNYLVRPAAWPKLGLAEAYRNASFVIYKL